jgi:hypothetical protein
MGSFGNCKILTFFWHLLGSFADADNGPKEISIYCPQNPVVSVTDLDYNLVSGAQSPED